MKPTKTWKHVERAIARYFPHGKRRGADFGDRTGGKNDVICDGYSVEVKHSKRPTWGLMQAAVAQAEAAREREGDVPLAVIHPEGEEYKNSLVVLRLETFAKHFLPPVSEEEKIE